MECEGACAICPFPGTGTERGAVPKILKCDLATTVKVTGVPYMGLSSQSKVTCFICLPPSDNLLWSRLLPCPSSTCDSNRLTGSPKVTQL